MFNTFSCLSVEDASHADSSRVAEETSGRDVASAGPGTTAAAVDGDGPPKPVNKPMVWVDLEMTGTFYVALGMLRPECVTLFTRFMKPPQYRPGHRSMHYTFDCMPHHERGLEACDAGVHSTALYTELQTEHAHSSAANLFISYKRAAM